MQEIKKLRKLIWHLSFTGIYTVFNNSEWHPVSITSRVFHPFDQIVMGLTRSQFWTNQEKRSHVWHGLNVFPCLAQVECFPALCTGWIFSRAWHRLNVFPHLAPVKCFPALGTGWMSSRTWHRLNVSRAWHRLNVFPYLAPVKCFPALGTGWMSSRTWHRLNVFPRLAPVKCFPALGTG